MTTGSTFRRLTDRLGLPVLMNLSHFAIIGADKEGGSKLYPRSFNEHHEGVAVQVREELDAFVGLPGFIELDLPGRIFLNVSRITGIVDHDGKRMIGLRDSGKRLSTDLTFDQIEAAMAAAG